MTLSSTGQALPIQVRVSKDTDTDTTLEIVAQGSVDLYGMVLYNNNSSGEIFWKFYFTDDASGTSSSKADLMFSIPGSGSPKRIAVFITTSSTTSKGLTSANGLSFLASDADGDAVSGTISNVETYLIHS